MQVATVGITNHAQEELSEIVFAELPSMGKSFELGDEVSVVESLKAASSIYAPLSGEVVEVNSILENNPSLINESAEQTGWIYKLKVSNLNQIKHLMSSEEYNQFAKS